MRPARQDRDVYLARQATAAGVTGEGGEVPQEAVGAVRVGGPGAWGGTAGHEGPPLGGRRVTGGGGAGSGGTGGIGDGRLDVVLPRRVAGGTAGTPCGGRPDQREWTSRCRWRSSHAAVPCHLPVRRRALRKTESVTEAGASRASAHANPARTFRQSRCARPSLTPTIFERAQNSVVGHLHVRQAERQGSQREAARTSPFEHHPACSHHGTCARPIFGPGVMAAAASLSNGLSWPP